MDFLMAVHRALRLSETQNSKTSSAERASYGIAKGSGSNEPNNLVRKFSSMTCPDCKWWYLACAIDCEGMIRVQLSADGSLRLQIAVTNDDTDWLEALEQVFGGRIERSGPTWSLNWTNTRDIRFILEHIVDKLRIKQIQGKCMLEFVKLHEPHGSYTREQWLLLKRLQEANQKPGKAPTKTLIEIYKRLAEC